MPQRLPDTLRFRCLQNVCLRYVHDVCVLVLLFSNSAQCIRLAMGVHINKFVRANMFIHLLVLRCLGIGAKKLRWRCAVEEVYNCAGEAANSPRRQPAAAAALTGAQR